jgi:arabinofuranan 3-O-arabinosyltransferase
LLLALAAVAYVPLLWSSPGEVSADTKQYLYLDPSRLIAKAAYLWDPTVGMGTVTHQTIGYLWPMGPYYWLMEHLGMPDWTAERLWLGTLLFAAGAGVVYLMRHTFGRRVGPAVVVASFAYLLSPYVLDYAARISVILMPWAALPWLIALAARSLRGPTWRWPALFALTIATVGGVNATALLLAGVGPVLWVLWAIWGARETTLRRALPAIGRLGVLTLGVSLWWIAGLIIQGRYGIDILRYTETYEAVARTSTAPEVLRGLGYWFFYGGDKVGPWVGPSASYMSNLWLVVLGYGLVALALTGIAVARFRHRGFVALLLLAGVVLSVGSYPFSSPTIFGRFFRVFVDSTAGLAMRSTPRAVPLVALALAIGLGAGAEALAERVPRLAAAAPLAAVALLALDMVPLFTGNEYTSSILRDENVPQYWDQAAQAMDAAPHDTRVYELPGSDFAAYRWGGTVDPITPGLTDRPYVARELVPWGSAPAANLLNSFEEHLQDGDFEPAALVPFAKLINAGTVAVRSDLQYERYRTPRPKTLWQQVLNAGLGTPTSFGSPAPNTPIPRLPLLDEETLSTPPGTPDPPPVATFGVSGAAPILHAQSAAHPLVVAGDGEGLVDAAAAGLLNDPGTVLYSASLDQAQLGSALAGGADLLLTDTNRRRGERWGSVRETQGYTEQAGEKPLVSDPTDNRLDVFPGAGDDAATVTEQRGVTSVVATGYGNPVTYTPEDRAANALDGDPQTAWRVGAFSRVEGERLVVNLAGPVTTDHITLLQPITGPRNRYMTSVRLTLDGKDAMNVSLTAASRALPGQRIDFPIHTFQTVQVEITGDNYGKLPDYTGLTSVGVAELTIGSAPPRVDQVVRLPTDLLTRAGAASGAHRLTVLLSRQRADQQETIRTEPELSISRTFNLPTARTFAVSGQVRVDGAAPDDRIDLAVGQRPATAGGVTAAASAHLQGEPRMRAAGAIDGDPTTAWQTPEIQVIGQSATFTSATPLTVDHLDLTVIADGRHSVPTALSLSTDGGAPEQVAVPPITDDSSHENATRTVRVALPKALTGRALTVRIDDIRAEKTIDYISEQSVDLPVAIAELGVPGLHLPPATGNVPSACRSDLVTIDGTPVPVRMLGTTATALNRDPLTLEACNGPVRLGAGDHVVRTAVGLRGGVDVDRLVLDSAAPTTPAARPGAPAVSVTGQTRVSYDATVTGATGPFWLVLGQSVNAGWHAKVNGHDLGPSTLVDGYANGWLVRPPAGGAALHVTLEWTPQREVWIALGLSALAALVCVVLVVVDRRRRRWPPPARPARRLSTPLLAVGALAVGAVVGGALPGLVGAGIVIAIRAGPRWLRRAALAVPAAAMAVVAAYVVAKSIRYPIPADLDWPATFGAVNVVAWCAVMAAVAAVAASTDRWVTDGRPDDQKVAQY